ncbi:MAG: tryptophan--tRNA ligase [Candidatus Eremiobacteraeota bacterium]|nr:tryptophan--tRNA ligase [Candidatus Eremiobacteraeota bacterium]
MSITPEQQELCDKDRSEKLEILREQEDHLKAKREEFGLEPIDDIIKSLPEATPSMKKGIIFSHKDFQGIVEAIKAGKPWAVVSGINPSGPLHLGHLALFKENLALQKLGAELFIPISEDESYVFDKAPSLAKARFNAYEHVIPSIIALGFDPRKTHIFTGADYPSIYSFALHIARHFSLNQIKGVFGFSDDINAGVVFYMGGVQMAHILLPQLEEFGGPKPTVVPVGIDQHPYIQVSRRYARKAGMFPPGELNLRFLPSLGGPRTKMAASDRSTCIYVTDEVKEVKQKIKTAYTGGSPVLKYQQQHGGVPDVCSVFGMILFHVLDGEAAGALRQRCLGGEQMCRDCKAIATEGIEKVLLEHQEALKQARPRIGEFMMKTPLRSIFSEKE